MIQDYILQQALNITHVLPTLCGMFRQIIAFSRCLCHNECDSLWKNCWFLMLALKPRNNLGCIDAMCWANEVCWPLCFIFRWWQWVCRRRVLLPRLSLILPPVGLGKGTDGPQSSWSDAEFLISVAWTEVGETEIWPVWEWICTVACVHLRTADPLGLLSHLFLCLTELVFTELGPALNFMTVL